MPSNGHGYGQNSGNHSGGHHMSYPVGVPVVYGFPSAPPNHVIPVPYLPHQGESRPNSCRSPQIQIRNPWIRPDERDNPWNGRK